MNTWQVLQQLKHLLENQTWPGGSKRAFPSVAITAALNSEGYKLLRMPLVLIRPGGASMDPQFGEEPDLVVQEVTLTLAVMVAGDAIGESALIGKSRVGGLTESGGRGLLELEEVMFDAITRLNSIDGVRIQAKQKSAVGAALDEGVGRYLAYRDYTLEVYTTADRHYHAPTRLAATDNGSGSATLTWTLPPDRFDRYSVVLRRATGSTAPTTATDGTSVTLASVLPTFHTDSPGAGTYSWALFAQYDETDPTPDSADVSSAGETILGISVS